MKKIHILFLVLLFAGIITLTFISCNKMEIIDNNISQNPVYSYEDTIVRVETYDGTSFMAFETVSVWENTQEYLGTLCDSLLDVWNNSYNFQSMRQVYSNDTLDQMPVEDIYVATCLNEWGIIQIVDKLYKINISQDLIYVLNEISDENVALLMNEEIMESTIDTFNLGIPVLIPEQDLKKSAPALKIMSCNQAGIPRELKVNDGDPWTPNWDYSTYVVDAKLVYQRVGIYFSIICKIKHRAKGGGPKSSKTYLRLCNAGQWTCKPICRSTLYPSADISNAPIHELSNRPYGSARPLHSLDVTTRFFWERKDTHVENNDDLHISYP